MQGRISSTQNNLRAFVVEERLFTCSVLSAALGTAWLIRMPFPTDNVFLVHIEAMRPAVYLYLMWSYRLFAFLTPFVLLSAIASFFYVHWLRPREVEVGRCLPPYPPVESRQELFVVLGEVHHQSIEKASANPHWMTVPEQGLYTGIALFGATGSGKTRSAILPLMHQLFGYKSLNVEEKLSGLVLEVKGDLCRRTRKVLRQYHRGDDYIEIGLKTRWRYNPLHNDLDAYALAFNIASLLTNIWGRGKEPFWQQSYTDLVKFIIILHKVNNDYVTLFDLYATAISPPRFEQLLIDTGAQFNTVPWIAVSKDDFKRWSGVLKPYGFEYDQRLNAFLTKLTPELERTIVEQTDAAATVYEPRIADVHKQEQFEAVDRWYWEHWRHLRVDIKTSVVQGIVVFLSLFDTNPTAKRVFCPPKELYEGKPSRKDPDGVVMPPFGQLIEQGKVCALNFPVALNPGLAKVIGTMMKQDYQRAVLLRVPKMEENPGQHFRPTVFLCDEYQNYVTVGANDPNGDEHFLSLSRQPKCIPIVATQSISSIQEALAGPGYKTLLQSFRTKLFCTSTDPDTSRYGSELCGKTERFRVNYTISESSNDANVGLLSGKASSNRASVSVSKSYQLQKEPLFDTDVFQQLKNAQAIGVVYDGITPLPPTFLFLKPDFMPIEMTWFEQLAAGFNPRQVPRRRT